MNPHPGPLPTNLRSVPGEGTFESRNKVAVGEACGWIISFLRITFIRPLATMDEIIVELNRGDCPNPPRRMGLSPSCPYLRFFLVPLFRSNRSSRSN